MRVALTCLVVASACGGGGDSTGMATTGAPTAPLAAVADGIVLDRRTGLEWTSRDDERALAWDEADRHCRALERGERTGWRLPEIEELRALYDVAAEQPCGTMRCRLDPAIRLEGPYVWSATTRSPGTRFYFDFTSSTSLSPGIRPTLVRRVLCVRNPGG